MKRIVAFGDSLTAGSSINGAYKNWTEIVADELGCEVINAGIGGHNTEKGMERLQKDVLDKNPTHVLINFGMNDHVITLDGRPQVEIQKFKENLEIFTERIRKAAAQPIFVTPNYIIEGDEKSYYYSRHTRALYEPYGGPQIQLDRYIQAMREVSKRSGAGLIDLRAECDNYDRYELLRCEKNGGGSDGVHPSQQGVALYAELICKHLRNEGF